MKKRKVLDIQLQKRRKNRRSIFLDDGSVFGVSDDVFFSTPIHIGDTISEQVLNEILDSESKTKIYNSAINLLSYRMRSKSELRDRLIRKNYNEDSIIDVINDSYDSYEKQNIRLKLSKSETQKFTIEFVYDRLRVFLKDKGLSQSAVQAIFGVSKFIDIVDDVNKINALSKFMEDPKGNEFLSILKRVRRILSIEEKKDNIVIMPEPKEDEVLIRIEASPINPSDLGLLIGPADVSSMSVSGEGEAAVVTMDIPEGLLRMLDTRLDPVSYTHLTLPTKRIV